MDQHLEDERANSVGGISWADAPIPRRFHRCYAHTVGWVGLSEIHRCACGAIRNTHFRGWLEKNSRRKAERDELRRKWRGEESA